MSNASQQSLHGHDVALDKFYYDNKIVKWFAYATIFWGLVGMTVGLLAAFQLVFPVLNLGVAETTFGRVRPVHTNAVIFAFVGNGIFMGVYYSLQRLVKARMFNDFLSKLHFYIFGLSRLRYRDYLLIVYSFRFIYHIPLI